MIRAHTLRVSAVLIALLCASVPRAMAAPNGSVTYTYDALGRVLTASYDTGVIVIYSYDAIGNRTQQVINVNTGLMWWGQTSSPNCPSGPTCNWDTGLWQ